MATLREVDEMVRGAGGRLVVFGSLAEGGFREDSDIDMAILGLPPERDMAVAGNVELTFVRAGLEADVITERFLTATLRERVAVSGKEFRALD
jgi:predicted nucleotidyltransferase